jgi:general secretion pathway protein E
VRLKIREALLASGLIDEKKIEECLKLEDETGQTLDRIILRKGYLTEEQALQILGSALGIRYKEKLGAVSVPSDFVNKVPVQFARNYNLVALSRENGSMQVATSSPLDIHPMDDLATLLSCEVEPLLAPRAEIANVINRAYKQKSDVVDEALGGLEDEDIAGITKVIEESDDLLDVANKAPIIKLVNMILFQALKMRASDIHIQPYEDRLQIRYRIDGILYDMEAPPKKVQEAIISRVKVMGKMDIAERRLPQDGRATIRIGDAEVDVRISSVPTSYGERIVMRLLDKSARLLTLEQLGLGERGLEILEKYIHYPNGIIFVTGPTGSGKTTTLYAVLTRINSAEKNVLTLEDPIEYNLAGVSQIQISPKKGLTFATGLRSLLRQDPDVMMVGEVRDVETARIAIQSALTGHLVFSTLHTNDAAGAVTRMLDIGLEPYLVSSSLILVVAQRLVRMICENCKEAVEPTANDLKKMRELALSADMLPGGKLFKGRGCDACFNTGFMERTAIYELLPLDDVVRAQIMDRAGSTTIKKKAMERGYKTLRMDGCERVIKGKTTVDEVLKVTQMDVL